MGSAPISSKKVAVRHLGDNDSYQDLVNALANKVPFRTYHVGGLRARSRSNYYRGFQFTQPGGLPEPFATLFTSHADSNEYTVFLGDTPIAWFTLKLGWVAPKLDGFSDDVTRDEWEKVQNAVLTITGKGGMT